MELQYEELNCYSCVLDTVIRREESRESIVPDSMPDIGTVLTVTASPMLHKTWIENGSAIVEGESVPSFSMSRRTAAGRVRSQWRSCSAVQRSMKL